MIGTSAGQSYASVRSFSPSHAWDAKVIEHPALPPRVVAVDKKEQVLTLLEFQSSLESTTTYLCSTGQAPGDKVVEGDLKTPEGIYFVVQHLTSGLDFDMYGYEAYTLNYPNPVDKIRRKTGYGIWVHGKGNGIAPLQTQGCIALNNNDLHTLGNKLSPGMPVIISNSVDLQNPSVNKVSTIKTLQDLSQKWAKAWGDRSASMFDFYNQEAYSIANEPFSAFKSNKERLFKRLPWIKTSIRDIQVLEGPGYWVTWFYQDYKAPNLTSKGVRRLYWSENNRGEFKIIGMEWLPGMNTSAQLVREDPPMPPIEKTPKTETVPQKFDTITAEMESKPPAALVQGSLPVVHPAQTGGQRQGQEQGQKYDRSQGTKPDGKSEPISAAGESGNKAGKRTDTGQETKNAALPHKNGVSPSQQPSQAETSILAESQNIAESQEDTALLAQSSTGGVIGAAHSPTPLPVIKKSGETPPQANQTEVTDLAKQANLAEKAEQTGKTKKQQSQVMAESSIKVSQGIPTDGKTPASPRTAGTSNGSSIPPLTAKSGQEPRTTADPQTTGTQESAQGQTMPSPQKSLEAHEKNKPQTTETLPSDNEILATIEGWRMAWERGDLEKYLDYYAHNAIQDRRTSKAAIEHHKKALWKRAHPKTVSLAKIHISRQGSTIIATMQQRYTSRNGSGDKGKKTLYFKQVGASSGTSSGTSWRIVKETWSNN